MGYRQPGAVSTVYIYDLKRRDIPDDPSAPAIKAEFEAAKGDMMSVLQQGLYSKVEPKEQFWAADAHNRTRLLCGAATVVRIDRPEELASYLCVGGWNGRFIVSDHRGAAAGGLGTAVPAGLDGLLWPTG